MTDSMKEILNICYDDLRSLSYQLDNCHSRFMNAAPLHHSVEQIIKTSVLKAVRTIQTDIFNSLSLINNILEAEDEFEIRELLRDQPEQFREVN